MLLKKGLIPKVICVSDSTTTFHVGFLKATRINLLVGSKKTVEAILLSFSFRNEKRFCVVVAGEYIFISKATILLLAVPTCLKLYIIPGLHTNVLNAPNTGVSVVANKIN